MSKTLFYSLAAIADIVIAVLAYRRGRIVIPVILVFAGICLRWPPSALPWAEAA